MRPVLFFLINFILRRTEYLKRTEQREQAFVLVFEKIFSDVDNEELIEIYNDNFEEKVCDYAKIILDGVTSLQNEIDEKISNFSNGWKVNRLSKIDLALLRLAFFEIDHISDVPSKVSVNECVELAKKYATTQDASFINGILGSYIRSL